MSNSTAPIRIQGLSEIADGYSAVLCDVWGVVHNGVRSFPAGREALARFRDGGGTVVLLTNAPRLSQPIIDQLRSLGVEDTSYDAVVTSGDVTRDLLAKRGKAKALHIGTDNHLPLYAGLDITLTDGLEADVICCTGLRDDEHESPDDYDEELKSYAARGLPMICANPDLVVERGNRFIWCAGSLAERYRSFGGTTLVAGKPHKPIYDAALARAEVLRGMPIDRSRVLAIGDGAPTDLTGACGQGLDVLFVTGGIHAANFGPTESPEAGAVGRFLEMEQIGARAFLPHLQW
ncbi:TIGR01459 family HAD-type hydrolase [Kaistia algarum]|uniref:TIGR01459 family HAD-type hydrolase n=1 Tax=Kaistia algarum TaxID=2083279 RepID=UPI000CE793AE|nr:TIGR01459 family HAD-type hydrolase [Kaistia algarum]MCX5512466.1 TIGR01459 family HAD-type hydrolase [Kaistia algarum]PPE80544.1 TIGR01459 family HAD-type hydrolase [Kaistia algarum]